MITEFDSKEDSIFGSVFLGGVGAGFDRIIGHQGRLDSFFSQLNKSEKKKNIFLYEYISKRLGENLLRLKPPPFISLHLSIIKNCSIPQ